MESSRHPTKVGSQHALDTGALTQQGPEVRASVSEETSKVRGHSTPRNPTHHDPIEDIDGSLPTSRPRKETRPEAERKVANAAPPGLTLAKSSPIIANVALDGVDDRGIRMTQSFAGFDGDGDGDTQPLETQVYRQYTSSALGMSSGAPRATASQSNATRVDLTSEWDIPNEDDDVSSVGRGELLSPNQDTTIATKHATDASFVVPKTPAIAGRKRNRRGEILDSEARTSEPKTSSSKTPGTELSASMFGNAGNVMSLTQAFNQTQAPSSPMPIGLRSDPIFDRPSPNFHPPQATSPLPRTSSPTKELQSDISRALTEPPIDQYRTMQESQEERLRRQQEDEARRRADEINILDDDDDIWNAPTAVEKRLKRIREHKRSSSDVHDRLGSSFAGRRDRPSSRSKPGNQAPTFRFDARSEDQDVQIPMTSSKSGLHADPGTVIHSSPIHHSVDTAQDVPATASQPEKRTANGPKATQATAIEDSQKEQSGSQKENDDPEFANASLVLQDQQVNFTRSQLSNFSSQAGKVPQVKPKDLVGTSSLPPPPEITSYPVAEDLERELPSSPPVMTSDSRDDDATSVLADGQDTPGAVTNISVPPVDTLKHDTSITKAALEGAPAGSHDSLPRNNTLDVSSPHREINTAATGTNTTSTAYQTAPSHSSPSPAKKASTQDLISNGRTPRSARVRKLTDIAADPTPLPSYEQVDLDGINIMNDEDEDFAKLMSGSSPVRPTRKKRAVYGSKGQRTTSRAVQPSTPPSAKKQNNAQADTNDSANAPLDSPTTRSADRRKQKPSSKLVDAPLLGNKIAPSTDNESRGTRKTRPVVQSVETNDMQELALPQSKSTRDDAKIGTDPVLDQPSAPAIPIQSQNRVIALCKDIHRNYWPATCIGRERDGHFKITFDDGTEDVVEPQHVRALDLRAGDIIKIDLPAMKKRDYIIQSTDMSTVSVSAKPSGKGALAGKTTPASTLKISVLRIYLTGKLWPQMQGREYIHTPAAGSAVPLATPTPMPGPSAVPTPLSRSRRATIGALKQEQQREPSTSSIRQESSLFEGMAFAASFKDDTSNERKATLRLLNEHGARMLDSGFETLFTVPAVTSTSKTPEEGAEALRLTKDAKDLGFVALITDVHSRRPKFLQALALGLPCLHYRWVRDCIAAKTLLEWNRYLLPAGESAWLGGAVRSRTLQMHNASDTKLADSLNARMQLISDAPATGVLLVDASVDASKALKTTVRAKKAPSLRGLDERRKRFVFMTYALGATHVRRVTDLTEAKALLATSEPQEWAWVYIDGDLHAAQASLGGSENGRAKAVAVGTKRKRADAEDAPVELVGDIRVVNDEFIIQSLILGAMAD